MNLKINASLTGQEISELFIQKLKENNIQASETSDIKFLVLKKDGGEVEMSLDKVKIVFNQE